MWLPPPPASAAARLKTSTPISNSETLEPFHLFGSKPFVYAGGVVARNSPPARCGRISPTAPGDQRLGGRLGISPKTQSGRTAARSTDALRGAVPRQTFPLA